MDIRTAIVSGALRALSDPDLDLSGCARVDDLRDVLQQEGAKLGISEGIQDAGSCQQLSQARPVRPHHRSSKDCNLTPGAPLMLFPVRVPLTPATAIALRPCSLPELVPSTFHDPWSRWIARLPPASAAQQLAEPPITASELGELQFRARTTRTQGWRNRDALLRERQPCTSGSSRKIRNESTRSTDERSWSNDWESLNDVSATDQLLPTPQERSTA